MNKFKLKDDDIPPWEYVKRGKGTERRNETLGKEEKVVKSRVGFLKPA